MYQICGQTKCQKYLISYFSNISTFTKTVTTQRLISGKVYTFHFFRKENNNLFFLLYRILQEVVHSRLAC